MVIVRSMQDIHISREVTIEQDNGKVKCPAQIRIGTRGSKLAVAQAMEVKNRLLGAFPELNQRQIEIIKIITTGDRIQDKHLADIGGKGLFTKEIEEALFAGTIDMAVHSMKDMPDTVPDGLMIECILEREDPRDAFISHKAATISDLPEGAVIGTSSVRRQSQILSKRPDLKIVQFRGNIITRLEKLTRGDVDATLLAVAGLKRVDLGARITSIIRIDDMLPAVAQGAIGVECAVDNHHIQQVLAMINHEKSYIRVKAERGFLQTLGGSCATPIAGYAEIDGDILKFRGLVASTDGKEIYNVSRKSSLNDAEEAAIDAGKEVLDKCGNFIF